MQMGHGQAPVVDDPLLSFRLADGVQDLDFKNMLQRSQSETERLHKFVEFAAEYIPRLELCGQNEAARAYERFRAQAS